MRGKWFLLAAIGGYVVLTHASLRVQADPWYADRGVASYYDKGFQGRKTASGERFSPQEMTAAHRKLPLGTKVMVQNLETGEMVEVRITDRGPYADRKRRIIDLSRAAAESIGIVEQGVARVRVMVTEPPPDGKKDQEEIFYEVQVGAFEDGAEAQAVLEQVQPWFPEAYIAPREGPQGDFYRVRVGPFETKAEARQIANALKRGGHRVFLDEVAESDLAPEAPHPAREAH
jgi:rare lipoprotein A